MTRRLDIENGTIFGRLTVLCEVPKKNGDRMFKCQCSCGNVKVIALRCLRSGQTQSCGCLARERSSETNRSFNSYTFIDETTVLLKDNLGNGTLIDSNVLDLVKPYYFTLDRKGYFSTVHTHIKLHRLITDCSKDMVVDHINHDKADNRKCNLRICTVAENNMNNRCKGYSKRGDRWVAYINKNHRRIHLGIFETEELARRARQQAVEKYFGEFGYEVR